MKKSSSASSGAASEGVSGAVKRAPRGHRQRGAGTVQTGKGDIVVSGVVLKEWQRTPKQLVDEWCRKQKRPRPHYRTTTATSEGSSSSGTSGSGSSSSVTSSGSVTSDSSGGVRCWLTLADPKHAAHSLRFLPQQRFSRTVEAEHAAALLALWHLGPELPRERVLPEPYRTMWLQLVGRGGVSDGGSGGSGDSGGSGRVGKGKGKKVASWRLAEEKAKAEAEEARLKEEQALVKVKVKTKRDAAPLAEEKAAVPQQRVEQRVQQRVEQRVVVDPHAVVELSSSLKFVSVKEKEQHHRDKAEERARRHQSRQVKELTNPDATCHMEERHRLRVEGLLRQAASERAAQLQQGDDTEEEFDIDNARVRKEWPDILKQLKRSGFSEQQAELALAALGRNCHCNSPAELTVSGCLDWLCLQLPESQLPPSLTVKGKHLEVVRNGATTKTPNATKGGQQEVEEDDDIDVEALCAAEKGMYLAGFTMSEVTAAMEKCNGDRHAALSWLCRSVSSHSSDDGDESPLDVEDLEAQREEEKEVLQSMFDDAFCVVELPEEEGGGEVWRVELQVALQKPLVASLLSSDTAGNTVEETISLELYLSDGCTYPRDPPVVLLRGSCVEGRDSVFRIRTVQRAATTALAQLVRGEELRGGAVLFACCLWVQEASDGEGLGAVLQRVADAQNCIQPKSSSVGVTRTSDGNTADTNSNTTSSKTNVAKPSTSAKKSTGSRRKTGGRSRLSQSEVSSLSKTLLESWKQKNASTSEATKAQGQRGSTRSDNSGTKGYAQMQKARNSLPAATYKEKLLEAVRSHQVVLVAGETGCGKTTQIPQFLLDDFVSRGRGGEVNLVCTQPRRLAAMGVAERVAAEQCSELGDTIGYQVRMDSRRSRNTRLVFCTTGILLRQLHGDPDLKEVTHLLVDEVHERDVDTDFLLALLRPLLRKRKDLKLVLMSATMDAAKFVQYFYSGEGPEAPVLTIPGFVHPVQEHYLDDLDLILSTGIGSTNSRLQDLDEGDDSASGDEGTDNDVTEVQDIELEEDNVAHPARVPHRVINFEQKYSGHRLFPMVAKTVMHAHQLGKDSRDDGAVLVFMSGIGEISRAITAIEQLAARLGKRQDLWLLPLHGSLSPADQQRVFQRPQRGVRKVVVCTNVAETSITIDDCVYVIDSGKMKEMQYEAEGRLSSLVEKDVSVANARQRRGRAGRVRPGHCFRLFTEKKHSSLPAHQTPEIHRVPLERLCLLVRFLGLGRPKMFLQQLLDPPDETGIVAALQHLRSLGAFDEKNALTPLGSHLASMPVDAQIGKLLVYGALLRCPEQILTIAAGLSGKSPFLRDAIADQTKQRLSGRYMSDHLALLGAVQAWQQKRRESGASAARSLCVEMGLHSEGLKQLWETRAQLRVALEEAGFLSPGSRSEMDSVNDVEAETVKAVLCAGLYPHLARVHLPDKQYEELSGGAFERNVPAKDIKFFAQDTAESEEGRGGGSGGGEICGGAATRPATSRVFLHPSSALFGQGSRSYSMPWLVYSCKVRTSKVFLRDVSMVSPYALLLFGGRGNLDIQHDRGKLVLDGWVHFSAPARVGLLVRELRRETEALLRDKIARPSLDLARSPVIDAILLLLRTNGL